MYTNNKFMIVFYLFIKTNILVSKNFMFVYSRFADPENCESLQ